MNSKLWFEAHRRECEVHLLEPLKAEAGEGAVGRVSA